MLEQSNYGQTVAIQDRLDRLRAGDELARRELIECACQRLERLTRKMLHGWQRVHRWEETSDVMQNAMLRLYRALASAQPASVADFFRLAALNIRRELHDLAKHYYGPCGAGARHATVGLRLQETDEPELWEATESGTDPARAAAWAEFHVQVETLPDEEREVFDLLWYQELSQAEAASVLGVSERTVKRRWAAARLSLHKLLGGSLPESDEG